MKLDVFDGILTLLGVIVVTAVVTQIISKPGSHGHSHNQDSAVPMAVYLGASKI